MKKLITLLAIVLCVHVNAQTTADKKQQSFDYNLAGNKKDDTKDYKGAIEDYSKAIALNPTYSVLYFNRGWSKQNSGDKKGACTDWKKALDLGSVYAKDALSKYCK